MITIPWAVFQTDPLPNIRRRGPIKPFSPTPAFNSRPPVSDLFGLRFPPSAFCFPNFNFLLFFQSCADISMNFKTCNVEIHFPSLEAARRMVLDEIRKSKREGVRVLKIIRG
jgi:hypothetical protein